ncbi:MAG: hypothetical protein NTY86_14490 [Deltaproteobacteria bacterium]|nr:hypothetical protein [Deltaproteobacteria bacterium]
MSMEKQLVGRVRYLRADFRDVVGKPFNHFYCPILFQDEETELCRAHIVNATFPGSTRWTVQRKDVDNFYGRMFEADFVDIRHRGHKPDEVLADLDLSKRLRPQVVVDGRRVEHYLVAKGPVPKQYSPFVVDGKSGPVRLALKIDPTETMTLADAHWQILVEKDLRIPALVSLLKAAHLTMFDMLGYRYALSPGGHLLGRDVLGEFYLANVGRSKPDVLTSARKYFRNLMHAVRPVLDGDSTLRGTAVDRRVYMCRTSGVNWGMIVLVRTATSLHAVLVPVFQDDVGAQLFGDFLDDSDECIEAYLTKYEGNRWMAAKESTVLAWPKADVGYPSA